MAPKTIKEALAKMLADLEDDNFKSFRHQLLDRREEPRVRRRRVEGKGPWEIADVLVSTFTEAKSVGVAVEILKQMDCNDEAKELDLQTKALTAICGGTKKSKAPTVPSGGVKKSKAPTVPRGGVKKSKASTGPSGGVKKSKAPTAPRGGVKKSKASTAPRGGVKKSKASTGPSGGVKKSKASTGPSGGVKKSKAPTAPRGGVKKSVARGGVKKPEEVEAEAKNRVLSEGGDLSDHRLVLSRYTIQLGKYKGKTFDWLMKNKVGYVVWLVNSHLTHQKNSVCSTSPLMANKDSLTEYAKSCPDFVKKLELFTKKDALQTGQKRKACSPTTSFGPSAAKKRKARSQRAQSTRGRSTSLPK